MEYFPVTSTPDGVQIDGIPDGTKVVGLYGPIAKRLADLALHKVDLQFADAALDAINSVPAEPPIAREAIWRSAIVHYLKCFGKGSRFKLSAAKIYKAEPKEAMLAFDYFKSLRNLHLVHDVNGYSQSIPGAVINDGSKSYKVEKVVTFSAAANTLEQGNYRNLKLLIQGALKWVTAEYDMLCKRITKELEGKSYKELASMKSLTYKVPTLDELSKKKNAP